MVAEDFLQDPQVRQWLDGVADLDAAHLRRFAGRAVAMKRSAASRANASTATRTADRLMMLIWSSALSLVLEGFAAYPVGMLFVMGVSQNQGNDPHIRTSGERSGYVQRAVRWQSDRRSWPLPQLPLNLRDHGEIGGNGGFCFATLVRFPPSLLIHAGRTDVEGARGQAPSHRSRKPVVVMLHPKVSFAGNQTFYLPPLEPGTLLHGWRPVGFALDHDHALRSEHPNICSIILPPMFGCSDLQAGIEQTHL